MSVVSGLVFVCVFLIGLCAVTHYFRNSPLPVVCWIVLFGAAYGVLQKHTLTELPWIHLTPDVTLYIFLPVLIFDSSRKLHLKEARAVAVPSIVLATLGILVSMLVMALPIKLFAEMPWMHVLLFCGIMSATDPVAVSAIFKVFPVPEKLKMLVEGESLLNDATTVILFSLLVGNVVEGHALVLSHGLLELVVSVAASVLLGIAGGWICTMLLRRWEALKNHFIGPLLPLLFIYLVFCAAQAGFDFSGVIAVMAATLTIKTVASRIFEEKRPDPTQLRFYQGFWDFLSDLANSVLFFMLGAEIGNHSDELRWRLVFIALGSLLLARGVVVYGFGALLNVLRIKIPLSWMHILNLGGLKGALSVALVLLLPKNYEYRGIFLLGALVMSLFTIVVNTLGTRWYIKKAGFREAG